jgi:hypothetical protein
VAGNVERAVLDLFARLRGLPAGPLGDDTTPRMSAGAHRGRLLEQVHVVMGFRAASRSAGRYALRINGIIGEHLCCSRGPGRGWCTDHSGAQSYLNTVLYLYAATNPANCEDAQGDPEGTKAERHRISGQAGGRII